jgi:uncharacterized protein
MSTFEIVGREEEVAILTDIMNSPRSEFLAMYGRRRIGKTYLIRSFFRKNIILDTAGILNGTLSEQLESFWQDFRKLVRKSELPNTWLTAFNQLKTYLDKLPHGEKKVIFIDEIAWFDTQKSGFVRALDNFWNKYCTKRKDIILVICGSASSWIIDKVINDKGGLHNRVTSSIHLKPFDIGEVKKYLLSNKVKLQNQDLIELYMLIGGVPFYLNHIKRSRSVPQIMDDLFLKPNASLKGEFDKLFASLFKNYDLHIGIVKVLSTKNSGMTRSDIIQKLKLNSGGGLSKALNELVECDFIIKTNPFQKKKATTIYRLIDEYSLFYLQFLSSGKRMTGNSIYTSQQYAVRNGYAFENFCFRHEKSIANALGISGVLYDLYSWIHKGNEYSKGAQIDMIFERKDNVVNIFEIKYSKLPFVVTKAYSESLLRKKFIFRDLSATKKNVYLTVVGNLPFQQNMHYLAVVDSEVSMANAIKIN